MRSLIQTAIRLAIGAVLLAWIFHSIFLQEGQQAWAAQGHDWSDLTRAEQSRLAWTHGPGQLWDTLRLVRPDALLLSLVFMGLTVFLGALRWDRVMGGLGLALPVGRCLEISLVAQFFNAFLLGSTGGDFLKAYYAARETHHRKTEAVVTVFVDRLLGLLAMLMFACLMMLPNLELLRGHRRAALLSLLILGMLGCCLILAGLSFWGGVSRGLPRAREWLRRLPKGDLLERSLDACRQFGKSPSLLSRILGLSMLLNIACVLQIQTLAWGLNLDIPLVHMLMIVPMIICVAALPITPSGLGVRENLYVLTLSAPQIGVEPTHALSLSLLAYAGFLFWSLIGGLFYLGMRRTQHLDQVAHPPPLEAESENEASPS